jgi:hypothetical protein
MVILGHFGPKSACPSQGGPKRVIFGHFGPFGPKGAKGAKRGVVSPSPWPSTLPPLSPYDPLDPLLANMPKITLFGLFEPK